MRCLVEVSEVDIDRGIRIELDDRIRMEGDDRYDGDSGLIDWGGDSPLVVAVGHGHVATLELLLEHGADTVCASAQVFARGWAYEHWPAFFDDGFVAMPRDKIKFTTEEEAEAKYLYKLLAGTMQHAHMYREPSNAAKLEFARTKTSDWTRFLGARLLAVARKRRDEIADEQQGARTAEHENDGPLYYQTQLWSDYV